MNPAGPMSIAPELMLSWRMQSQAVLLNSENMWRIPCGGPQTHWTCLAMTVTQLGCKQSSRTPWKQMRMSTLVRTE